MRKWLTTPSAENIRTRDEGWLDVERAALIEITSEQTDCPIEAALVPGDTKGWRAADAGSQTIRLVFNQPQRLTENLKGRDDDDKTKS